MKRIARDAVRSSTSRTASRRRRSHRARSCSPARCRTCRRPSISRSSTPASAATAARVAIRTGDGRVYVGPDNGLLTLAADRGPIDAARSLTNPRYHLEHVSRTFHARDIFAPVAAHLAVGVHFDDLGEEVDPATLVRLDLPVVGRRRRRAPCDRARRRPLRQPRAQRHDGRDRRLRPRARRPGRAAASRSNPYYAVVAETYADAGRGELILYEDSYGAFAIAISGGSAAALTEAAAGDLVRICPA